MLTGHELAIRYSNNDASIGPGDETSGSPRPGLSAGLLNRHEGFGGTFNPWTFRAN